LALASDEDLVLTRLLFFAWNWRMASGHARMTANAELLAARLRAGLLAFSGAVALLLALVRTTSQTLPAHFATAHLGEPARLVLQDRLAA
jgi:hypothetical protein